MKMFFSLYMLFGLLIAGVVPADAAPASASAKDPVRQETQKATPKKISKTAATKKSVKKATPIKKIAAPKKAPVEAPGKENPQDDTKKKAADLLEKLNKLKNIEPATPKKIDTSLTEPFKAPAVSNPLTDSYPGEDATMREYYRQHPGTYSPPLLNY